MNKKEFLTQLGLGNSSLLLPVCDVSLGSFIPNDVRPTSIDVDFTVDIPSGSLASEGRYLTLRGTSLLVFS